MNREQAIEWRRKIENAARYLPDNVAVDSTELYTVWKPGMVITLSGDIWVIDGVNTGSNVLRLSYGGKLYKVQQPHTTSAENPPSVNTSSLYSLVSVCSVCSGTQDNPIVFEIGMILEEGRYYSDNGKLYYCYAPGGSGANPALYSLMYYGSIVREVD